VEVCSRTSTSLWSASLPKGEWKSTWNLTPTFSYYCYEVFFVISCFNYYKVFYNKKIICAKDRGMSTSNLYKVLKFIEVTFCKL
jgi:hypothetical protein